jgi:FlaA1/EpsC-like NDP-sugar epimerase
MAWWLQDSISARVFRVVGFIDDDLYKQNTRLRGVEVLGKRDDIPALVSQHDIGIIIFAIHNIPSDERKQLLAICSMTPAKILMIPDVLGDLRDIVDVRANNGDHRQAAADNGMRNYAGYVSNVQIKSWLDELGEISDRGDLSDLQAKIVAIRMQIGTDTES